MSQVQQAGDLELNQDLDFQRRSWKVQRVAWVLMALFVLVAVLGLLGGGGPLSSTTGGSEADGLRIEYDRFLRQGKPSSFDIRAQAAEGENQLRLWIERSYLSSFQLEQIVPEPSQTETHSEQLIFTFDLTQPGDSIELNFELRPERVGSISGKVGIEDGPALEINHFIYP